jgi:hypothetical protein
MVPMGKVERSPNTPALGGDDATLQPWASLPDIEES